MFPQRKAQLLFLGQSNPELHCIGLPWVTCPSLSLSCGLLALEFIDWQSLGHKSGEEDKPPGLRVGKGWPPKDHWEKGRLSRQKPAKFSFRVTLKPKVSRNGLG